MKKKIDNCYEEAIEELKKVNNKLFYTELKEIIEKNFKDYNLKHKNLKDNLENMEESLEEYIRHLNYLTRNFAKLIKYEEQEI